MQISNERIYLKICLIQKPRRHVSKRKPLIIIRLSDSGLKLIETSIDLNFLNVLEIEVPFNGQRFLSLPPPLFLFLFPLRI